MGREDDKRSLVLGIELRCPHLLREIDVAENLPAGLHGRAQKGLHRRVVGWEADVARIVCDAPQAQRLGIPGQDAEDPLADWQGSDRKPFLGRDARGNEIQEPAVRTDHTQGPVSRVRQLDRQLDDPLQDDLNRQVRRKDEHRIEQLVVPIRSGFHSVLALFVPSRATQGPQEPGPWSHALRVGIAHSHLMNFFVRYFVEMPLPTGMVEPALDRVPADWLVAMARKAHTRALSLLLESDANPGDELSGGLVEMSIEPATRHGSTS